MRNSRVHQSYQRLQHAFKLVDSLPAEPEVRSHYARYLCVLCSGFIEVAIRTIFVDYARRTAVTTSDYVSRQLRGFRNPKSEEITQIIIAFDKTWSETFIREVDGAPSDSINSIVDNRNQIAHGENVGISYHTIKEYHDNAMKVIRLIDDKFGE